MAHLAGRVVGLAQRAQHQRPERVAAGTAGGEVARDRGGGGGRRGAPLGAAEGAGRQGRRGDAERIELLVAAVVSDVLPNGNLVISGSQGVRVNFELRILNVAGIVRPVDIAADNTISYDRIAEARIAYGGRGRLMEVQQPPWGQQLVDDLSPF